MKLRSSNRGYSSTLANQIIDPKKPIYNLSDELEVQNKFVDGKPTDEVASYRAYFSQEGLEPFAVKFMEEVELPAYLAPVSFDTLEACEVNKNIYFRATDINEVI